MKSSLEQRNSYARQIFFCLDNLENEDRRMLEVKNLSNCDSSLQHNSKRRQASVQREMSFRFKESNSCSRFRSNKFLIFLISASDWVT